MRKHLYLVTEHDKDDRVGGVKVMDQRMSRPEKNNEGPIQKFDKEAGDFYTAGKMVSLGYVDFEDEQDYEENFSEAVKRKLAEIDERWCDKAGLDVEVPA
jgi:hypothetical protein